MNCEVTCFEIDFKKSILKIYGTFVNSKYFFNQNISKDSRNSGEFLLDIISRKIPNLDRHRKIGRAHQNLQLLNNEIANSEQITRSCWLNNVSKRS